MKKNLLLLMLALLLPAFMYGQEQTVSGTVLDTYNMGVPGASIVEKGTTNGTITDFDGNYTLTVSNKNATLVFSFIGYKTQEIPVAGKAKVDVILQENAEQLDEVVVTGYGVQRKAAFTGAASHFYLGGMPDITVLVLCAVSTLVFARLAAVFANKASAKTLNRALGVVLTVLGVVILAVKFFQ